MTPTDAILRPDLDTWNPVMEFQGGLTVPILDYPLAQLDEVADSGYADLGAMEGGALQLAETGSIAVGDITDYRLREVAESGYELTSPSLYQGVTADTKCGSFCRNECHNRYSAALFGCKKRCKCKNECGKYCEKAKGKLQQAVLEEIEGGIDPTLRTGTPMPTWIWVIIIILIIGILGVGGYYAFKS